MKEIEKLFQYLSDDSYKMLIPWKKEIKPDHFEMCHNRENKCYWELVDNYLKGTMLVKLDKNYLFVEAAESAFSFPVYFLIFDDYIVIDNCKFSDVDFLSPYIKIIKENVKIYQEQIKKEKLLKLVNVFKEDE